MPTYQIEVDGIRASHTCDTGDYAMVVVAALVELGMAAPRKVRIWCNDVAPEYGPYWYRVGRDRFGSLKVEALSEDDKI